MRAEQVYNHFLAVIENFAGLKGYNDDRHRLLFNFVERVLPLIERGYSGDLKALDQAEAHVRELETAYHFAPPKLKQSIKAMVRQAPSSPSARQSETEQILEAIRGPTGWRKYGREIIVGALGAIFGGIGLYLIQRFVLGG